MCKLDDFIKSGFIICAPKNSKYSMGGRGTTDVSITINKQHGSDDVVRISFTNETMKKICGNNERYLMVLFHPSYKNRLYFCAVNDRFKYPCARAIQSPSNCKRAYVVFNKNFFSELNENIRQFEGAYMISLDENNRFFIPIEKGENNE